MHRPVALLSICLSLLGGRVASVAAATELWLYYAVNLQVDENVDALEQVWRRAANAGYTHVMLTDAKFARLGDLGDMTGRYFANVERVKRIAAATKLEIVPALFGVGYSNNMLWHDPNLAEGLPVKDALFEVRAGEARLLPEPGVSLPPKPAWHDPAVQLAGGVATVRDHSGNARLVYRVRVAPYRCYHVSVSIRTQDYQGSPEIKALAGDRSLQYQYLGVARTQDWTKHHVVFNSLGHDEVSLYFGVWGDAQGELQWKDWQLEEAGPVNILRRPGAPCVVRLDGGSERQLVEGQDYEPIIDPKLGATPWPGQFDSWHEPPAVRVNNLPDGARLRISWHHPAIIYDGQVCCCLSEPKTMDILADEARRMKQAWNARGYMMQHDELRTLNWDACCQRRGLSAGAMLADNVQACRRLLGGSGAYVWSDMFDPRHNAVKDYYLVRGDLAGAWEGLDKDVVVVNWNFGQRDESLRFFADRGHRQLVAGYYDGGHDTRQWIESARQVKGVVGYMYTTWANNYTDLEKFARDCRP